MKVRTRNRILETGALVAIILVFAKLAGFIKQIITAAIFGTSLATDIMSLSETLISNIDYLLIQTFVTAFVPIYIRSKTKGDEYANQFAVGTVRRFLFICIGITLVLMAGSPLIAKVLAPEYGQDETLLLSKYILLFAPGMIIVAMCAIFNAVLRANEKFVICELLGLLQNVILIAVILAFNKIFGIQVLLIAFYSYALINLIIALILSKKYWKFKSQNNALVLLEEQESSKRLLKMTLPLLFGYSAVFLNQQIDKILASGLDEGSITALGYGSALINFITTFVGAFCVILFTNVSKRVSVDDHEGAASLSIKFSIVLTSIFLPFSIVAFLNAKEIVTVVFGRGSFNEQSIAMTSSALMGYALLIVPFVYREIFSKFIYCYEKTIFPTINSVISIAINIALSILLVKPLGLFGIALATSISVAVNAILNIIFSKKQNHNLKLRKFLLFIAIWLLAGAVCVLINLLFAKIMDGQNAFLKLLVCASTCLACYAAIIVPIYLLRNKIKYIGGII